MHLPNRGPDTISAEERAARLEAKAEGWQLFWRYIWSAGVIVGSVGIATLLAHWMGGPS